MDKEFIDVDYTECDDSKGDVTVNLDPASAAVSGICGVINNITNSVKEYNMCREQEETKRAEIRMQLKLGLAQIDAQKQVILTQLEHKHEIDMAHIKMLHESVTKRMDAAIEIIHTALEKARETNDFSTVIELMKMTDNFIETRSQFTLQALESTSNSPIMLNSSTPKGYIE